MEAAQLEHQVHLGRPATDTAHGYQGGDQIVVASPRRPRQHDRSVQHLGREIAQRRQLVRGEARGSERLVGGCIQRLRRQVLADRRPNAAVDRLGRAACELLEDDRTHERPEGPVRIAWAVADRSDTSHEFRDDAISRSDLVDCDAQSG